MENINKIELQNIKKIIEMQEIEYKKLCSYTLQTVDPQIKQIFTKAAQDSLNTKQKIMSFLND